MSLNDTLDRLSKGRDMKEQSRHSIPPEARDYAERIFFGRMLKDINHGMGEPKIEELIDRSVMIARMMSNKLKTN